MHYIEHPAIFEGERVKVLPLEEHHFEALVNIARAAEIWAHLPIDGTDKDILLTELRSAVLKRMTGEQYPFVVTEKATGNIIGTTRFHSIFPEHRKLEIGWTWYDPAYWGAGFNTECKFLMLSYCFEKLNAVRVQFQTRETNFRSREALQKIGAKFEGLLRKERIRYDGPRNTAIFSIIDDEWQEVKAMLINKMTRYSRIIRQEPETF